MATFQIIGLHIDHVSIPFDRRPEGGYESRCRQGGGEGPGPDTGEEVTDVSREVRFESNCRKALEGSAERGRKGERQRG